jgi:hypothetical protein
MPKLDDYVFIRATVECPGGTEESWTVRHRAEWDSLPPKAQQAELVELAVEAQNEIAPCGAAVEDVAEVPEEYTRDPERWI